MLHAPNVAALLPIHVTAPWGVVGVAWGMVAVVAIDVTCDDVIDHVKVGCCAVWVTCNMKKHCLN